jgi:hypothetical protein
MAPSLVHRRFKAFLGNDGAYDGEADEAALGMQVASID